MIGETLRTILDTKAITLETLSQLSGVPVETIRNLLYRKAENPRLKTVLALSRAPNISIESLLSNPIYTTEEQQLLEHYRRCSPHGRHLTRFIAAMESETIPCSPTSALQYTIPIFLPAVSADESLYTICDIRYLDTFCQDAFAAIRIPDNTFAPIYYQYDIVLLSNRFPNPGEHAVFLYDGHVYLREFIITSPGNQYTFTAIHGRGNDIHLKQPCKYTLLGTCIGILRENP